MKKGGGIVMTMGKAVRRCILPLCEARNIAVSRLSVLGGVTQSGLNNIMSGRNHMTTAATIKKFCDGPNIAVDAFFCSLHDPEQEPK